MTEVVETQETAEPTETEQENKPALAETKLPMLNQSLLSAARELFDQIKGLVDKQNAVGNVGELLSEAIKSSTDPQVVKLREKIERANKAINDATVEAESLVKPTLEIPSEEEIQKLETERKEKSASFQAFANAFDVELTRSGVKEKVTLTDYTGSLPGKRRGAKPGSGTGTSRPRLKSVEYTTDLNGDKGWQKVGDDKSSTFTHLLGAIKKETGADLSAQDLHGAWMEQNSGASDWTELPEVSTFAYSVTGKDGKSTVYHIRATK